LQVQTWPKPSDFSGRKNPQHAFLGGEVQGWAMKLKDFKATSPYFLSVSLPNPVKSIVSHVADLRHVKEP
jgi:hypothetical protein